MESEQRNALAEALVQAHATGVRVGPACAVETYEDALIVQSLVQRALGPVGGFKVARRAEGGPVMAPIRQDRVLASGADVAVRDRLGIELEVGFRLLRDPEPGMMARPQDYFAPCAVLELVDTRWQGADGEAEMMKLADMQINAGLVIGSGPARWDGEDFGEIEGRLTVGETVLLDGAARVPGGSALANLELLLSHVGAHCGGLVKGQTLITGSVSGLHYFPGGREVRGHIEGLGAVGCGLV